MCVCPPLNQLQQMLVHLLIKNRTTFLVIGGQAVRAYLPTRMTTDLDILLSRSSGNARKLENAFKGNLPPSGRTWRDIFTSSGVRLAYPNDQHHEADLLTSIDGIDFGAYYARSIEVSFGDIKLRVPCLGDLITLKHISLNSGNDGVAQQKDLQDIVELEALHG
jgi:hypothetical protein